MYSFEDRHKNSDKIGKVLEHYTAYWNMTYIL